MERVAVRAEALGKRYRTGLMRPQHDRLSEALTVGMKDVFRAKQPRKQVAESHIWALRNLSLEIREGEVVGIIGRNGAGKTTLLKLITGITEPTEGCVGINGRIGSLLEVGTGFHPELTGRENILLNGAIIGMRRQEILSKFDQIVEFAGTGDFLDTPVKRYSSGMAVRLAFSVAAHLEPEILVVDEVLAVGDARFQQKSLARMGDVAKGGRTVLFVSHNMGMVGRLCERVVWIDDGQVRSDGPADEVISEYLTADALHEAERVWPGGTANPGVSEFRLDSVSIRSTRGALSASQPAHEPFTVELAYRILEPLVRSRVGFSIAAADGTVIFESYDSDQLEYDRDREPGSYLASCTVPGHLLKPGRYFLNFNAGMPTVKNLCRLGGIMVFTIEETGSAGSHMPSAERAGLIRPKLEWRLDKFK